MTDRILTPEEVATFQAHLAELNTYLAPAEAVSRLDSHFAEIQDNGIHSGYECIPEYAPIWENGLLNCIESARVPPVCGSRHYSTAAIDAWFLDCYAPSIMCQPRAA